MGLFYLLLLKLSGYFMYYHAENSKIFYVVLTLPLWVLYRFHNKQRLLPYTALTDWFRTAEVESVYRKVRTESFYKTNTFLL